MVNNVRFVISEEEDLASGPGTSRRPMHSGLGGGRGSAGALHVGTGSPRPPAPGAPRKEGDRLGLLCSCTPLPLHFGGQVRLESGLGEGSQEGRRSEYHWLWGRWRRQLCRFGLEVGVCPQLPQERPVFSALPFPQAL